MYLYRISSIVIVHPYYTFYVEQMVIYVICLGLFYGFNINLALQQNSYDFVLLG